MSQSQAKVKHSSINWQAGKKYVQAVRWMVVSKPARQPGGSAGPLAAVKVNVHKAWAYEDRLTCR